MIIQLIISLQYFVSSAYKVNQHVINEHNKAQEPESQRAYGGTFHTILNTHALVWQVKCHFEYHYLGETLDFLKNIAFEYHKIWT